MRLLNLILSRLSFQEIQNMALPEKLNQSYEQAVLKTTALSARFDTALEDYFILRTYTNGIIKEFKHIVNQVMSMWNLVDMDEISMPIPIPGLNLKQIKQMVEKQMDSFNKTMPQETAYQDIQDEIENWANDKNTRFNNFEQRISSISERNELESYRQSFNNQLDMEINKIAQAGKSHKHFLNKLSNEIMAPLQMYAKFTANPEAFQMNIPAIAIPDEIGKATSRFSDLLTDYQFFDKFRNNQIDPSNGTTNPDDALNKIIEKYTSRSYDNGYDLFFKIDSNLPSKIRINNQAFEVLIQSLLDNTINILLLSRNIDEIAANRISLKLEIQETKNWRSQWIIATEDNGVGFPSRRMNDVFSFFKLYSEKDPFANLKFSMLQELVSYLGGDLTIDYEDGKSMWRILLGVNVD